MLYGDFFVGAIRSIKINDSFSREFLVSFPSSRIGTVGSGVFARILMMSSSARVRKSSIFTAGKFICFGKNTTLSAFTSSLVVEM